ncbi:hypothetical protein [Noviherbaspirillum sp. UKPF54]|uniref:hypothetical protein n=1 Tax=Noviherbaspirillum sp. UKPF54 TaxID=2601898 RepID=UPI0011B1C531|nr:hypothetical protein [Noviherbaspirillum sp. UKPF54]QDZ29797.1 hypothetical protein FAY22_18600 [Noviherbaspirillum sp. UKPF54]
MKVRHVFAALLLACSVGQSALAQEEPAADAKPEAAAAPAPAAQDSKPSSHHAHRARRHAAKAATREQAPGASGASGTAGAAADEPAANAEPANIAPVHAAPIKAADDSAPVALPSPASVAAEKVAAPALAAQDVPAPKPAAAPVPPAAPTQPGWLDNFLYQVKATDVLLVLLAGLLVSIARAQSRRLEQTARATGDTAQAAEKTARTAENALVAGQRAFMFLREFKTFLHLDDATGQYRWTLHPVWENSGNTPTKGLEITTTYRLLDEPLPQDYDFPGDRQDTVNAIAGPRALVEGTPGSIGAEELAAVQQGKKYFYIWGRAEYHDIFEGTGKHTTRFCNQLMQVIGDPGAPIGEYNMVQMMFGFHNENNSAD